MAASNGQRKLGLVAFDDKLEIVGDGVEKPITESRHEIFSNFEACVENGKSVAETHLKNTISDTKDSLL